MVVIAFIKMIIISLSYIYKNITLETQVPFLGREDPLEKEMAIHASTFAWKIPWTEEACQQ